ncbi:MAG: AmmeMemoRadiSam system protein A [Candidatus Acidiferrales bacterium]
MSPLRNDEKRLLLQIARRAIESALAHAAAPDVSAATGNLAAPRGAFVTLRRSGRLRGCIGRVASSEPLAVVVAECAVAAATGDPRFPHLEAADLRDLQIELSVLSCTKRAAPEEVQPGIHGLVISQGDHSPGRRGVLLPQVAAEHRWSRERFLEETCEKAGLAPGAWQNPDTCIEIFTAEVFSETDVAAASQSSDDGDPAASADAYSNSQ